MPIKWYSAFSKTPALLEPHQQIIESYVEDLWEGGSYPSAERQSVYSRVPPTSRQGKAGPGPMHKTCSLLSFESWLFLGNRRFYYLAFRLYMTLLKSVVSLNLEKNNIFIRILKMTYCGEKCLGRQLCTILIENWTKFQKSWKKTIKEKSIQIVKWITSVVF